MADSWDFVVVGGGHNGLSAACTLAEAGASVVVLEQRSELGGLAHSHAHLPDAPEHLLSLGAMDDLFMSGTSLSRDLGLQRYGHVTTAPTAPYGWIGEDGETLLLFRDLDRTLAEIRRYSTRDARTYQELQPVLRWIIDVQNSLMVRPASDVPKGELGRLLLRMASRRSIRSRIGSLMSSSLVDFVADNFESDALRSLVTYWASMIGPIDMDGGGCFCVGLAAVHSSPGIQRPRGGMGGVIQAFARHLADHGGDVRLNAGVDRVIVDSAGAQGVLLKDGTEIVARRAVLAAVPPQLAYGSFLDDGVLDSAAAAKVAMLPASANNVAFFKIDIAAAGLVNFGAANRRRKGIDGFDVGSSSLMTGTFDEQIKQLKAMRVGDSLDVPPIYLSVLSNHDRTQAPTGQSVLYLCADVPSQTRHGWDTAKSWYEDAVMKVAAHHLDGLDTEIGRVVTSPADFERLYGTPGGQYFHVDMTPWRLGANRPARGLGASGVVDRYYISAAGAHPGGGVSGWAGRHAATLALREA
ncbi:hypothetical protein BOO86_15665 [Mycobacterium sp. CBMA 234]|uniref:phytoene desaturase family protein n=1 Tax=Mycolicibacterium sp. CBMA 234 TaxID=1918495 RepID=UPI001391C4BB|nr:NAD(P)/FAD-dependent oxidoreductase [Mycolicibacterium sp. CBMA 234]MUL65913.1 hypothetical protein [Mycolicibacterium sp. CBMA 234]